MKIRQENSQTHPEIVAWEKSMLHSEIYKSLKKLDRSFEHKQDK
jgi:hypothetical protein